MRRVRATVMIFALAGAALLVAWLTRREASLPVSPTTRDAVGKNLEKLGTPPEAPAADSESGALQAVAHKSPPAGPIRKRGFPDLEVIREYGRAVREFGIGSPEVQEAAGRLESFLRIGMNDLSTGWKHLIDPRRDWNIPGFLKALGLGLSAEQEEAWASLMEKEEAYELDELPRRPADEPWLQQSLDIANHACEWDRRIASILNPAQLAALLQHEGDVFGRKDIVLARRPPTNCERVNFRDDIHGDELASDWAREMLGLESDPTRFRAYAAEYARQMLEIDIPDYAADGPTMLRYRRKQLEIQAQMQRMMLEDRSFSDEELAKIREWKETYEGDR